MSAWYRAHRVDWALRATGLVLCSLAYAAFVHLMALHIGAHSAGLLAYGLAASGFLCASAGSALAILGSRLFERIDVGARWYRGGDDEGFPHIDEWEGRA
jgi:hypothetical protein